MGDFGVGAKNLAGVALGIFKKDKPPQIVAPALRASLEQIANMPESEYEKNVDQIIAEKLVDQPEEAKENAKELAILLRDKTRTKFIPQGADPTDPATKAVIPENFDIETPEQLVQVAIPVRLSRFKRACEKLVSSFPR